MTLEITKMRYLLCFSIILAGCAPVRLKSLGAIDYDGHKVYILQARGFVPPVVYRRSIVLVHDGSDLVVTPGVGVKLMCQAGQATTQVCSIKERPSSEQRLALVLSKGKVRLK